MRQQVTWVLVANGAYARVFVNAGPGFGLTDLPEGRFDGNRSPSRDLGTDRPGRTFDRAGPGRHAMQPPSDPHDLAEEAFLKQVCEWLVEQEREGQFDRLVLIAAPRSLGTLRANLAPAVAGRVVGEIARDLIHSDIRSIGDHLDGIIRV